MKTAITNSCLLYLLQLVCISVLFSGCLSDNSQDSSIKTGSSEISLKAYPLVDSAYTEIQRGDYENAKRHFVQGHRTVKEEDTLVNFFILNQLGVIQYQFANEDSAIYYWDLASQKYAKSFNSEQMASLLTNLGSAYMGKGYYQTSISYFLEAKRVFERLGVQTENFWINHINIGVAYMESRNFQMAFQFFNEVPVGFSNTLDVLVHINLAKWHALQKDEGQFLSQLKEAEQKLESTPFYRGIYQEVELEYLLFFKNYTVLQDRLEKYGTEFGKRGLYFDLLINSACLYLKKPTFWTKEHWLSAQTEIPSDDFYFLVTYYKALGEYYSSQGKPDEAYQALVKMSEYEMLLDDYRDMTDLLDYTVLSKRKEIEQELEVQIRENEAQSNSMKAQVYFILALVFLIFLLVVSGGFIYYRNRHRAKIAQEDLDHKNLELNLAQQKQLDLEKDLSFKSQKLKTVLITVNKIAILKKQIESFFQFLDEQTGDLQVQRTKLRQLKLDFNLFFNNYQDLAVIANLDGAETGVLENIQRNFPQLNDNDLRVIMLITQNYTSKEMAMLLSCSEKNIEYYRTQIRKKLEIPKEISIKDYIELNKKNAN